MLLSSGMLLLTHSMLHMTMYVVQIAFFHMYFVDGSFNRSVLLLARLYSENVESTRCLCITCWFSSQ